MLVHTVSEDGVGDEDATEIEKNFRLKDIAIAIQDKLGLDVSQDANIEQQRMKASILANGGTVTKTSFQIYKADLNLLAEYGAADTDLTLRVCYYYLKLLAEENLEDFFFVEEVMPLYKEVTIPMEMRGLALDIPLMHKIDKELVEEQAKRKKIVLDSLMEDSDAINWLTDTCTAEYPPSTKGKFATKLCELHNIALPLSKSGKPSLSAKAIQDLRAQGTCPALEYLATGDLHTHLTLKDVQEVMLALWTQDNDGDLFNIQSKKQMGEIVFHYKGEKALSQTKKGADQFNEDMIQHLSSKYKWANDLRVYNKLLKIKSTYIDRFLEAEEDGIFYPYFKQHGTVSGRYGSNLQQLPKPLEEGDDEEIIIYYKNVVRKFFKSRPGYVFIDSDYASLEPHCFASVTGDQGLRDIFNKGWDFYSTIAIRTEKLDQRKDLYPDGVSPDTKATNFLKKIDPSKRNKAKGYSLGVPYGMSDFALAMTLGVSKEEGKRLHAGYLDGFPGLKDWIRDSRITAATEGRMVNKVGRIRHLPKYFKLHTLFGDRLMDWKFKKELAEMTVQDLCEVAPDEDIQLPGSDKTVNLRRFIEQVLGKVVMSRKGRIGATTVTRLYRDYKNARNNCLNYQLQSLAAAVVNRAAIQINRKARLDRLDALVVAQIHDQLVIEVLEDQAQAFAPVVQDLMEKTTELEGVTLKAPPEIAYNLADGH
jgi:DNA polymerase I-like protein with 3'-5' exonuclease and polymerase domains